MTLEHERLLRAAANFLGRRHIAAPDEVAAVVDVSRANPRRYCAGRAGLLVAAGVDAACAAQLAVAANAAAGAQS